MPIVKFQSFSYGTASYISRSATTFAAHVRPNSCNVYSSLCKVSMRETHDIVFDVACTALATASCGVLDVVRCGSLFLCFGYIPMSYGASTFQVAFMLDI